MALRVEIIGVEPACHRCKKTMENAEKAITSLRKEGIDVTIRKLDVMDRSIMERYGMVRTPALAVNGVLKMMGKVPDPGVIERIIRKDLGNEE
jgi:hypothetical protein